MKIFLAGGSGVVGQRLIPLLRTNGHDVIATTTTTAKTDALRALGAAPVVVDGLDRDAVIRAVVDARPDAIVHQMTALSSLRSFKHFDQEFALTNRLRTEGTQHLLDGAKQAGAKIFVAQSYTGWPYEPTGGRVKTEDDPLNPHPPKSMSQSLDAIRRLEQMVTAANGIVLRYGSFYPIELMLDMIRQRKFPVVGDGGGVWSFTHFDDAAGATLIAIERNIPGIYNIVDDEPAEVRVWIPEVAKILGAKPPMHVPAWLARFLIGDAGVAMMTTSRGASNAKAKRVLGWTPKVPSWRVGFRR